MAYNPYNRELLSSFGSQMNNIYGLPTTVAPLPQTTVAPMLPSLEYSFPVTGNMPNRPIHPEVDVAPLPQVQPLPPQVFIDPPSSVPINYNPPAMPHPPPIVQTVGGTPPPFAPQMPNRTIDPEIVARGGAPTRRPKPNTRPTPVANTMAPSTPCPVKRPSYSGFYQR
jgi:hypothetical protein